MLNLYYTLRRTTQTHLVEPVTHTGHTPHFPPLSYHFLHHPVKLKLKCNPPKYYAFNTLSTPLLFIFRAKLGCIYVLFPLKLVS